MDQGFHKVVSPYFCTWIHHHNWKRFFDGCGPSQGVRLALVFDILFHIHSWSFVLISVWVLWPVYPTSRSGLPRRELSLSLVNPGPLGRCGCFFFSMKRQLLDIEGTALNHPQACDTVSFSSLTPRFPVQAMTGGVDWNDLSLPLEPISPIMSLAWEPNPANRQPCSPAI